MKSLTLQEIALQTNARLMGNPQHAIRGVADLEAAHSYEISFLKNLRYLHVIQKTEAGAIFVTAIEDLPEGKNYLIVEDPSMAFQKMINFFFDATKQESGFKGIHSTAVVHPTVKMGEDVEIGPYAVIDQNVTIGDKTKIGAHVFIGPSTSIGEKCLIHPHVTVRENCIIGKRVILQPGAVIGSCGFGYITNKKGQHIKLEHVGNVILEDNVEIGANTTIDRSRFQSTIVGQGAKIDNLVQLGHSVKVGAGSMLISQVGIAGSTQLEPYVVLGGQVGVAGHLKLGKGAQVAAGSGVSKSLEGGRAYSGIPAQPIEEYNRNAVYLKRIEKYLKKLEDRLQELEK